MAKASSKRSAKLIKSSDKDRLFNSFGKRLKMLRLSKGISPRQFRSLSGIDEVTLRKYESGKLEPRLLIIMNIAKALGVSHLELMNFDMKAQDIGSSLKDKE